MPKKGDDLELATALVSLDHHGVAVKIGASIKSVRAIIHRAIDMIDPESGLSTYGNVVEVSRADLLTHKHGDALTVVATGEVLKLQKTIKDDGYIKQIEVTR